MAKVPELSIINPEPVGESLLAMLDYVREEVLRGELSAIAIAKVNRAGEVSGQFSKIPSRPLMLGAIAFLQHDILHAESESN